MVESEQRMSVVDRMKGAAVMTRTLLAIVFAIALAILGAWSTAPVALAQRSCGVKPVKPVRPIGCSDLVAECRCDSRGRNCRWEWICVRR